MKSPIHLFVDTGGTFTDCIAYFPDGREARRKVLSHGAIRGVVKASDGKGTLVLMGNWGLERDILRGYRLTVPGREEVQAVVKAFDPAAARLVVAGEGSLPREGEMVELSAGEEAPVLGARLITGTALGEPLPPLAMRLGTTRGTNALLEKKGGRTLLVITKGFGDLLHIGDQQRPDIFAREVKKAPPLPQGVMEVEERVDAAGRVLSAPAEEVCLRELKRYRSEGFEAVAIALLNAYRNPVHEELLVRLAREAGFRHISASALLTPMMRFLPRTETAVVNAYLSPVVSDYLEHIRHVLHAGSTLHVMTSAGGLVQAADYQPKDSLLSGPAGGVVGAAIKGLQAGSRRLITFDMGGTSTDVSRYHGRYDYRYELEIGGVHVMAPALTIETVAAGGGSVCWFDGHRLRVGPESAGATPGPACYGAGGPLTLTDVNLLLGRLDASSFGIPVFPGAARDRLNALQQEIREKKGEAPAAEELLTGFLEIANEIMAGAIRKISVARGYAPSSYDLLAFGGAGGMHAASVAELLGIRRILIPQDAGLLSAYGIGHATLERFAEEQVLRPLRECEAEIPAIMERCGRRAMEQLAREGVPPAGGVVREKLLFMRFRGQESSLEIPWMEGMPVLETFRKEYERIFGHFNEEGVIEVESVRVIAAAGRPPQPGEGEAPPALREVSPHHHVQAWVNGRWRKVPVYLRDGMRAGDRLRGFALFLDEHSTTVVEEGWSLVMDHEGTAVMSREKVAGRRPRSAAHSEVTELELFTNRFSFIAGNMGSMLQRTALSVNIKERLDFSCALLGPDGGLVVNAPHIPVHLGSLGVCVRKVREALPLGPGDTVITNHPAYGGSHLPDVTLITPVYEGQELIGYVVNRAHHAEIGGIRPGSMPADAVRLSEEGVVIPPTYLVKEGQVQWERIRTILTGGPWPTRALHVNLADINAALAANRSGAAALLEMICEHGKEKVLRYMGKVRQHAASRMRETLRSLPDGEYVAEEHLDDGTRLHARITIAGERCTIDFSGTDPVHPGNLNATEAIVNGVVIYVLRLLVNEPVPLNDGLFEPVEIILPECLLNPSFPDDPARCPAIVGGNVEVSQRLTDTLLKPFGILACSQGTMNNLLFGDDTFSYYETIGGGCGAGPDFDGASGVHHHMTNTRITDAEVLEYHYPVRLERFALRRGSGGGGRHRGGDGLVREILFLKDLRLSLLTQHRTVAPYGLEGGKEGQPGRQTLIRKDGKEERLASIDGTEVREGDRLVIETPGGGGFGKNENGRGRG